MTDESTLEWYAGREPCDVTVQGSGFGPGMLVYGLQKDSPFTKPLNDAMLQVQHMSPPRSGWRERQKERTTDLTEWLCCAHSGKGSATVALKVQHAVLGNEVEKLPGRPKWQFLCTHYQFSKC